MSYLCLWLDSISTFSALQRLFPVSDTLSPQHSQSSSPPQPDIKHVPTEAIEDFVSFRNLWVEPFRTGCFYYPQTRAADRNLDIKSGHYLSFCLSEENNGSIE